MRDMPPARRPGTHGLLDQATHDEPGTPDRLRRRSPDACPGAPDEESTVRTLSPPGDDVAGKGLESGAGGRKTVSGGRHKLPCIAPSTVACVDFFWNAWSTYSASSDRTVYIVRRVIPSKPSMTTRTPPPLKPISSLTESGRCFRP